MDNLHVIQMQILRELTFKPNSRFSDLNLSDLTNDHFSYHVRTLIKLGLVEKADQGYSLTHNGKTYSTNMDTDKARLEERPKVSVFVIPFRKRKKGIEYAIHTRRKEPYYGYSGFITGKVRFGETITQAASREMMEELGISGDLSHKYILHEMVYDTKGSQLEDKFFHIVEAKNIKGRLLQKTEDGVNSWVSEEEYRQMKPRFHNDLEILEWYKQGNRDFKEEKYIIETF